MIRMYSCSMALCEVRTMKLCRSGNRRMPERRRGRLWGEQPVLYCQHRVTAVNFYLFVCHGCACPAQCRRQMSREREGEGPFEEEMIGALGVGRHFCPPFSTHERSIVSTQPPRAFLFLRVIRGLVDEADRNLVRLTRPYLPHLDIGIIVIAIGELRLHVFTGS